MLFFHNFPQNLAKMCSKNESSVRIDLKQCPCIHSLAQLVDLTLQSLLYQRQMIPEPAATLLHERTSVAEQFRATYQPVQQILRNTFRIANGDGRIREFVMLVGATPFSPKEIYRVRVPPTLCQQKQQRNGSIGADRRDGGGGGGTGTTPTAAAGPEGRRASMTGTTRSNGGNNDANGGFHHYQNGGGRGTAGDTNNSSSTGEDEEEGHQNGGGTTTRCCCGAGTTITTTATDGCDALSAKERRLVFSAVALSKTAVAHFEGCKVPGKMEKMFMFIRTRGQLVDCDGAEGLEEDDSFEMPDGEMKRRRKIRQLRIQVNYGAVQEEEEEEEMASSTWYRLGPFFTNLN